MLKSGRTSRKTCSKNLNRMPIKIYSRSHSRAGIFIAVSVKLGYRRTVNQSMFDRKTDSLINTAVAGKSFIAGGGLSNPKNGYE
ncbi:hypothetical protein CU635_17300 [Bacillus canaveralius]|uniref:Uncharacterized protein n=1 Tax=Bacillus canaveralius TaxID=1403243 RepID=A0A2N5GIJ1_9BACI|nr:hypothetical protein CU635_17300 [Bacillus canaveralius]